MKPAKYSVALAAVLALVATAFALIGTLSAGAASTDCSTAANPVVCENQLPGDPPSNWEVSGIGDSTIQGYATSMGVQPGQTISFKINTPSTSYHIDILRLGWYGGDGARLVASNIQPTASLPQSQPACQTNSTTGDIDCGNWSVSASWTVPSNAVSGIYIAHLVRDDSQDPGGASQIPFVVTDPSSHSDILVPTDDATWQAYNDYGGNSLYTCTVACPPGSPGAYKAAYAVSYNRPWDGSLQTDGGASYLWYAEYQTVQFLERNGYDVSYTDDAALDSDAPDLLNHKLILFSGHDEYWSGGERANVTAARNAGVNLAFFTGNEVFWKTRWGASTDGSNTPYRTLITYKETHFNAPVDPADPPTWTGTWGDPRFSPPADGGNPSNSLTGQMFEVNQGSSDITVPYQYSKLPLWQNTAVANLTAGHSLTLGAGDQTLGYEWDVDADNGFRPAGEFDLSSTTVGGLQTFLDYGTTTNEPSASGNPNDTTPGATQTHNMSLYRASSGALVFGAGTVQWSWGLDNFNAWGEWNTEPSGNAPDPNMQQATVNLLSLMAVQPGSLQSGLVAGPTNVTTTPPTSTITSPAAGATIADGSAVTVSGTATDNTGQSVAGVEVSTDGGHSWHPAKLTTADGPTVNWSYSWIAHGYPSTTLETRAVDGYGNLEQPSDQTQVNITCPCSLWGTNMTPTTVPFGYVDGGDSGSVEVGVSFKAGIDSQVTGIRFYKGTTNTGTHVGSLWTSTGTLLAQGTFTNETASGWQTLTFSSPVLLQAGQTYVAGYFAPKGHYSQTPGWFYPAPAPTPLGGATDTSGPWSATIAAGSNGNGLYAYGSSPQFPNNTYGGDNYWVDPILQPLAVPGQVTGVSATSNANGGVTVSWSAPTTGGPPTQYTITPYVGGTAQATTTVTGGPPATSATLTSLSPSTTYTFTVQASNSSGAGPVSAPSNSITPAQATAPGAPTGVSGAPASGQALVSWSPPASNGGSAITGYTVTVTPAGGSSTTVQVGGSATSTTVSGLTNGTSYTFKVAATNSVGTGNASAASAAVVPEDTIFDFGTPKSGAANDSSSVNLGVQFQANVSGTITGIRFYKPATDTGTHVGSLWSATGTLLAQGTFTGETASGWQTLVFSTPVSVTLGTTYVASYLAPAGNYPADGNGFAGAVTNGPLTALASGSVTPGNGVYAYGSSSVFPRNTYGATNYWVDVLFQPAAQGAPTAPGAPTGVSGAPASGQALVSWSPPASNGGSAITGYTVTVTPAGGSSTTVQVGGSATSTTVSGLTNGSSYTFKVAATNSVGTGAASAVSSGVTPEDTIFDFGTPKSGAANDSSSVNLGVQFQANASGTITGIRFYKPATDTGTHVGSLWSATGTLLAQGTFTGETASGWQTLVFSTPVSVTQGTTYVASYLAPVGNYAADNNAFAGAVTNGPLTAPASGSVTPGNGLYAYGSSSVFPSNTYGATNYWVDVLFQPAPAGVPGTPTGVSGAPASGQVLVSWSPPASNGGSAITGYTVTVTPAGGSSTTFAGNGSATSAVVTGLTNGTSYTFNVAAVNSVGTGNASAASAAVVPEDTIFDFGTPKSGAANDSSSVNLGVQFQANVSGTITGIRFYKPATDTGTHVGSLWSATGTLLAQGTFTGETASGWQTLVFSTPVSVTQGTTYVASYLAPVGNYASDNNAFAGAVTNGPLTAPASGSVTPGNGVYAYGSSSLFPSNTWGATNYWVDVLFKPGS